MYKRNDTFDTLKLLFSITIYLNHCSFLIKTPLNKLYDCALHNGRFGVCFFFMCSGYCIYEANYKKVEIIYQPIKFAINHVKKVYPLYLFTNAVVGAWEYICGGGMTILVKLCLVGSLLQTITIKYGYILNSVGWYLSVSFILYCMSPLLIKSIIKIRNRFILLSTVGILLVTPSYDFFVSLLLDKRVLDGSVANGLNDVFPLYWVACYSLGMILNRIPCVIGPIYSNVKEISAVLLCTIVYFTFLNFRVIYFYRTGAYIFACAIMLLAFENEGGFLSAQMRKLSNIARTVSAPLFLIHYVVIVIGDPVSKKIFPMTIDTILGGIIRVLIYLVISIAGCILWNYISAKYFRCNGNAHLCER